MWNLDRASVKYAGATVFLCLVALVGMLLPWATPKVVYMAGEPTVIDIGFWGDSWGYDTGAIVQYRGSRYHPHSQDHRHQNQKHVYMR